jgi:predicted double-glycine peptidase
MALIFALVASMALGIPENSESLSFRIVPRQMNPESCGYAVVAGLIDLMSGSLSEKPESRERGASETELRNKYGPNSIYGYTEPISLSNLVSILEEEGIETNPVKITYAEMLKLLAVNIPIIIHLEKPSRHFVLGTSFTDSKVVVADPSSGLVAIGSGELSKRFSGYAMIPHLPDEKAGEQLARNLVWINRDIIPRSEFLESLQTGQSVSSRPLYGEITLGMGNSPLGSKIFEIPSISALAKWDISSWLTLRSDIGFRDGRPAVDFRPSVFICCGIDAGPSTRALAKKGSATFGMAIPQELLQGKKAPLLYEFDLGYSISTVRDPVLLGAKFGAALDYIPDISRTFASMSLDASCIHALSADLVIQTELGETFVAPLDEQFSLASRMRFKVGAFIPLRETVLGVGAEFTARSGEPFSGKIEVSYGF